MEMNGIPIVELSFHLQYKRKQPQCPDRKIIFLNVVNVCFTKADKIIYKYSLQFYNVFVILWQEEKHYGGGRKIVLCFFYYFFCGVYLS